MHTSIVAIMCVLISMQIMRMVTAMVALLASRYTHPLSV